MNVYLHEGQDKHINQLSLQVTLSLILTVFFNIFDIVQDEYKLSKELHCSVQLLIAALFT